MMSSESQMARIESVRNMLRVAREEHSKRWRAIDKLRAFDRWFEPPASLSKSIELYISRLYKESDELRLIRDKLELQDEKLCALPSWKEIEYWDGHKGILVFKGILPNFEETSEDEAEALKMLEEYYATQENEVIA